MQINHAQGGVLARCLNTPDTLAPDWFDVQYWRGRNAVMGSSRGRYTTWFVKPESGEEQWVLRHYWRGGLMDKFSKDAYFYTGLESTRAISELALLETLHAEGFAVPRPIAARVVRFGLWYRADIIIARIEGAEDLVARLGKQPMTAGQWQRLGATIARFHRRGVYHADLNAKNILLTDSDFYLIDFDRGEFRAQAKGWQQANLKRLLRSFNKEKGKQPQLAFDAENWQQLLLGYRQATAD
jgi:3-deoxy-D-manno-octulosonic acid kinase